MGKILYLNSNATSSNVGFKSIAHCHLLANNRTAPNRHSLHEIRTHLWAWNINSLELNLNENTFYFNYFKKVFFYIYLNKQHTRYFKMNSISALYLHNNYCQSWSSKITIVRSKDETGLLNSSYEFIF